MAASVNKTILLGKVGKDVELKYSSGGKAVANLTLATSKKVSDKWVSTWHNLTAWGKTAELLKTYVKKGDTIYIEGSNEVDSYTTKDGQKRYKNYVLVQTVQFLNNQSTATDNNNISDTSKEDSDNIPF